MDLKLIVKTSKLKIKRIFESTYYLKRNKKIIFILSTGRCGSTSITEILNQHPRFKAFHEAIPQLISLSTELAENKKSEEQTFLELKKIFKDRVWEGKKGEIIVHSDHRLWNLVPILSRLFPNSFFVHLMRNPFDSINSYLPRGWYSKEEVNSNIYAKYRLNGYRVGGVSNKEWEKYNRLEKCTWYWEFVNNGIRHQLKKINPNRYGIVRLENMLPDLQEIINRNLLQRSNNFIFSNVIKNQTNKSSLKEQIQDDEIQKALMKINSKFYPKTYNLKKPINDY